MKQCAKYLILSTLFISLNYSCEKDQEDAFVGKWELSEFRLDCPSEGIVNLSILAENACMQFQGETFCLKINFESETDGKLSTSEDGSDYWEQTFTYTLNDNRDIVNMCLEGGDCEEIHLEGGRLRLRESDPECPAEYFLDKK